MKKQAKRNAKRRAPRAKRATRDSRSIANDSPKPQRKARSTREKAAKTSRVAPSSAHLPAVGRRFDHDSDSNEWAQLVETRLRELYPPLDTHDADAFALRETKRVFMLAFALRGTVTHACGVSNLPRQLYDQLNNPDSPKYDAEFNALVKLAWTMYQDLVQAEVHRRAIDGWNEPVFGSLGPMEGTGVVGHVRRYSDKLLDLHARRTQPSYRERDPEKDRPPIVNVMVVGGGAFDPAQMTQQARDHWRQLLEIEEKRLLRDGQNAAPGTTIDAPSETPEK